MENGENQIDESIIDTTKFIDGKDKTDEEIECVRLDEVYRWLKKVTKDFKFMVALYSCGPHVDQEEDSSKCLIKIVTVGSRNYANVTSEINIDSNPRNILDGKRLEELFDRLVGKLNPKLVRKYEEKFESIDIENRQTRESLIRLFASCMPASFQNLPVIIFDIEGYSKASPFNQFALKHELNNRLERAKNLINKFNNKDVTLKLNKLSTGDGFYVWSYGKISQENSITFMLMLMLITMSMWKVAQKDGQKNKLRAAFAMGDLYTIPYKGLGHYNVKEDFTPDAFGDLLNDLNRIISKAKPEQILVSIFKPEPSQDAKQECIEEEDFTKIDRQNFDNTLRIIGTVKDEMRSMFTLKMDEVGIDPIKSLLLTADPQKILFSYDKHNKKHLFINIYGSIIAFKTDAGEDRKCCIEKIGLKRNPAYESSYQNIDDAMLFEQ